MLLNHHSALSIANGVFLHRLQNLSSMVPLFLLAFCGSKLNVTYAKCAMDGVGTFCSRIQREDCLQLQKAPLSSPTPLLPTTPSPLHSSPTPLQLLCPAVLQLPLLSAQTWWLECLIFTLLVGLFQPNSLCSIFIRPMCLWGPIYGFESLKLTKRAAFLKRN